MDGERGDPPTTEEPAVKLDTCQNCSRPFDPQTVPDAIGSIERLRYCWSCYGMATQTRPNY